MEEEEEQKIRRKENFEKEEAGAGGDQGGSGRNILYICVKIVSLLLSMPILSLRISS